MYEEKSQFFFDILLFWVYAWKSKGGIAVDQNICHLVPYHQDHYSIHTINFVLEWGRTQEQTRTDSVYKLHLVSAGTAVLKVGRLCCNLQPGDVFFTFPASAYTLEPGEDFRHMYISFLGARANMIMEKLKITRQNCVFSGFEKLIPLWTDGLDAAPGVIDLMSESVLLHSFATLGQSLLAQEGQVRRRNPAGAAIKRYVDDHFMEQELSLEVISRALSYHEKYISTAFKEACGVGLAEYLSTIRIQNACTLMEDGFTAVGDIAARCGFADAQYFSRVFKSKMGMPPSAYMKSREA